MKWITWRTNRVRIWWLFTGIKIWNICFPIVSFSKKFQEMLIDWKGDWNGLWVHRRVSVGSLHTHALTHSLCLLSWLLPQAGFIHVRDKICLCLIYLRKREWLFESHCFVFWLWFYGKEVQIFTSTLLQRPGTETSTGWCGRWGDSHKKTEKELESRGTYTGRMSIFLTWVLSLHQKAMSLPNQL